MPRVTRTAVAPVVTGYPTLPVTANAADLVFTAADATNFEQVVHTERVIILARNTGVGVRTVTITSAPYLGRTGDISAYSLDAGDTGIFGPFPAAGFRQTDGKLYFAGSHAEVLFAVIAIP